MTNAETIAFARQMLPSNPTGYARVLSGAIRAASSARTAKTLRAAITEDKAEHHFVRLDTVCPLAA